MSPIDRAAADAAAVARARARAQAKERQFNHTGDPTLLIQAAAYWRDAREFAAARDRLEWLLEEFQRDPEATPPWLLAEAMALLNSLAP